jgi:hypothetical protein
MLLAAVHRIPARSAPHQIPRLEVHKTLRLTSGHPRVRQSAAM